MAVLIKIEVNLLYGGKSAIYEELEEGATLFDLLVALSPEYKFIKEMLEHGSRGTDQELIILINGKYPMDGFSTKLNDGDKISIVPIIAGG